MDEEIEVLDYSKEKLESKKDTNKSEYITVLLLFIITILTMIYMAITIK